MASDGKFYLTDVADTDFEGNRKVAREGGGIAGNACKQIEAKTGKRAISSGSFAQINRKKLQKGKTQTKP